MPDPWDAVIVGGGLAGLTCAALLGKAGCRAVLLEKNRRPGGYAVSYKTRGYRFDVAVQALGGCGEGGAVSRLLRDLGREEQVRFLRCEPARAYYFPAESEAWIQPGDREAAFQALGARFPGHGRALERCREVWTGLFEELERIPREAPGSGPFGFSRSFPLLSRYGGTTLGEFLDELDLPGAARERLTARAGYCMLPPSRLSLVGFACMEATYGGGAWLVQGGVERLTRALATAASERGVSVETGAKAVSILTGSGRVRGVALRDGRVVRARNVVVASAARPALEGMLDAPELLPGRYAARLAGMEATGSYYTAFFRAPQGAVEGLFPNVEVRIGSGGGEGPPEAFYLLIPSLIDPSAAPPGFHSVCLSLPCHGPPVRGPVAREALRVRLLEEAERRFPGLTERLGFLFDMGPGQYEAVTGNSGGSAYGWAQVPEQSGIRRLNVRTPVPGLYLAGHWTMPGGGIAGVVTSGRLAAESLLRDGAPGRKQT